jgi:hypothetical protein
MSMFAGARLSAWQAYLIPLALMAITDPILAVVYGVPAYTKYQIVIYASFVVSVWLGQRLTGTQSPLKIAAFTLLNSFQFFVITNFGSWLWFQTYPKTTAGLAMCCAAAVPFFGWTLAGDIVSYRRFVRVVCRAQPNSCSAAPLRRHCLKRPYAGGVLPTNGCRAIR